MSVGCLGAVADVRFAGKGSLQAALDAGAGGRVTIAKGVWEVDPGFVRNGTEIVFEDGAELVANPKGFFAKDDCVLTVLMQTNVIIRGGTVRMHRQDYLDRKDGRIRSQWRHGLSLRGAVDVRVEDMRFCECGGDGVYVADWQGTPCRNISVRRSLMSCGLRQGMSVIDVDGLLIEGCTLERTLGENPQAGIDFEPNRPCNRLKGVVMRNCRFLDNVRKGINLHLDALDAMSEPVGFLIENCTCVSNAIGLGLCFNTKEGSFVKGAITVRNCRFAANREAGIDIDQKPLDALALSFHDVTVEDSCRELPKLGDIHVATKYPWDAPTDGILFDNVTIRQTRVGPWFSCDNATRRTDPPRQLSGQVTVVSPDGRSETVALDAAWATKNLPSARGTVLTPRPAPDWSAYRPTVSGTMATFERLPLRGHLHFPFYVDRPRTVTFACGLSTDEKSDDKAADLAVTRMGEPRKCLLAAHPTTVRLGRFVFKAPTAGWYDLYAMPGRNEFVLAGSTAPTLFSLGKARHFESAKPCLDLPKDGSPSAVPAALDRPTDGWDNVNPARRFPAPIDVRWQAPLQEGASAFSVDWRKGAKGRVVFGEDFLRIEKDNDVGSVVVSPRQPVAANKGEVLQAVAGVSLAEKVDPEQSRGFLRIYSGKENLNWQRDPCGKTASDAPQFKTFVNAAPGNEVRQLARCVADASGAALPVLVVEGKRSVSVWRHWTVESAKQADAAWHRRTSKDREPPDRSATMMDEAAFDRMLVKDKDHEARIVRRKEGARLEVDRKSVPPVFYKPIPFGMGVPFTGEGRAFEGAGVNLQVVNIRLGVGGGRIGFWSKDGFDVEGAVRRVKDFMRSAPHSLFLLTIRCDAYPEYASEHPDEIWRRRDGSPVYGACSQGEKTPSANPPKDKWLWVSNHSLVWREDVKRHMTTLVAALKAAGLAKRIVGVHLAGYHDGQFATPTEDFSPCALKSFARWQQETFGAVRWTETPVYDDGELIDPEKNPLAAEYQKFLKWGPMRMQEDLARHLKAAFGKPIVVGRWCMTPYGGSLMSTLDFTPFLKSDAIDFLVAQPAYHRRAPGLVGGVRVPLASFRDHGKLFLNEFDTRTWHGRSGETEPRGIFLSEATDLAMWETVHRKLAGQMFAQRMGWWYFDMADNWFDEPSILAEIASVRQEADARVGTSSTWRPSAAFVIDEEGCLLRNRVGKKLSMREAHGTAEQLQRLAGSGVPFDTCVADDFLAKPSLAARYKVLVLCGFYRIDAKRRAFVERARKAGVKLVFLVDAGALGGAEVPGDDVQVDEPGGLSAEAFGDIVRAAGGYVPARHGLQVDMNGDFVSIHCIISGRYDFALPFAADVTNLKTGERQAAVQSLALDLVGGETRWYALKEVVSK